MRLMHVLYVHQNYPAQFGHIAAQLSKSPGWKATYLSQLPPGQSNAVERIQYTLAGGATKATHFSTRTFENAVWHTEAVYRALRKRPDIKPDLIVGHSGFGSTLFLRDLYPGVPIINLFEYYYHATGENCDISFRHDLGWPMEPELFQRARCRNAMILLDLQNCDVGYCPTEYQRSLFPSEYQPKLQRIFDGVDRSIYHSFGDALRPPVADRIPREIASVRLPGTTRVVTYVSRGFESMRGFDVFLKATQIIGREFPDVMFFVVGTDRIAYGGDEKHIAPYKSFKEWTVSRGQYDLSRITFTGRLNTDALARLLASSDLHIYLTVPFVLSWSMMDAMSCGAVVLGSDTAPVREMITPGQTGLLADFFSPEDIANQTIQVLKKPDDFRPLGQQAEAMIRDRYSLEAILPEMVKLYTSTTTRSA